MDSNAVVVTRNKLNLNRWYLGQW